MVLNRVNDWSNWDDAYNFIAGRQPDFLEKNINDAYLKIAKLNHILFFDLNGKLIHSSSTFHPFSKWQTTEKNLEHIFQEIVQSHPTQNTTDIINLSNRIIIWAATPVTDSEAKLDHNGYLFMARELDTINSPDFADYFGHEYRFTLGTDDAPDLNLQTKSNSELNIQFPLVDNRGKKLALVNVLNHRSENLVAAKTKSASLVNLLLFVLVGVIITYFLIHALVIRRLSKITSEIPNVLSGKSDLLHLETDEDEISDFARFFNDSVNLFHQQAERANEAHVALSHSAQLSSIGEIAGSIVHEIKNPLSIISMSLSQMKRMFAQNEIDHAKLKTRLVTLEETVRKINSIINTVSRFSRRDLNDFKQSILLKNVVDDSLFLMNEKIRSKNIQVKTSFQPELTVECNPALLALVIGNLISNSIDAIETSKEPWVEVDYQEDKDHHVVSLTDSGNGLPPEFVERMKQPYFTTKPQGKGTGLGLSFSRKVMSDHKGNIQYDSSCSNTRFLLKWPKSKIGAAEQKIAS